MPDWSYQPLFRPLLSRLPPEVARDLTLGAIGSLARLPGGIGLIALLGHMDPPDGIAASLCGIPLRGPIGLAGGVDPHLLGTRALMGFGFGFIEVGPVTRLPLRPTTPHACDPTTREIGVPDMPSGDGLEAIETRLERLGRLQMPLLVRLAHMPRSESADEIGELAERMRAYAAAFAVEVGRAASRDVAAVRRAAYGRPVLLALHPDGVLAALGGLAAAGADGYLVGGGVRAPDGRRLVGRCALPATLNTVAALRSRLGPGPTIVAEGGVEEPADALALQDAGASLIQVYSGLIFSGPGLPKRINEAVAARAAPSVKPTTAWRWQLLLGLSMILGGCLAWVVAAQTVTLPYDDAYLGLDRAGLAALSPRILAFMAHDRVTLAGTMLSIGVLYSQLAWWGMRRGAHWAWKAVVISAGVGFGSFFLFLGFGYFDPLHAAVSVVLFGFFVAGLSGRPRGLGPPHPALNNDRAWWLGLYGQLCFVAIGVGLVLAGLTIAGVGITTVFVHEDVTFLRADPSLLRAANAHLLPLIAHDRAGFGGALVSDGLAVLFVALWGFRRGAAWLWWTLLLAGVPGFGAAIGVHAAVGYGDALHLAPVFIASALFVVGLTLSRGFLCAGGSFECVTQQVHPQDGDHNRKAWKDGVPPGDSEDLASFR